MPDTASSRPRTLVDKIWDDHLVAEEPGASSVLAIDLHLVHEVTSPQAFTGLRARGPTVRRPGQTVATADHSVPTHDRSLPILDSMAAAQVAQLEANCRCRRARGRKPQLSALCQAPANCRCDMDGW